MSRNLEAAFASAVDYRALNSITRKDRYPLPLINETLERIGKANWFTKLDVVAALHKLRIAPGSEWMTAFKTRYGLYKWLVTPFGLANAPSSFQKYINWAVREFLDEFLSADLDDVLIFTTGSLCKHREHVSKVLSRLQDAGLYLDIRKCEFEVQSTKYLGFIIEAGQASVWIPRRSRRYWIGSPRPISKASAASSALRTFTVALLEISLPSPRH